MESIEVRCCCDAGKIMGWLTTEKELKLGEVLVFRVLKDMNTDHYPDIASKEITISLTVSSVYTLMTAERLKVALKSNDYPIEELAQIPGFVPNLINKAPV